VRPAVLVAGAAGFQKRSLHPNHKTALPASCQKEIGSQPSLKHTQGAAITQAATATLQQRRGIYPLRPCCSAASDAARLRLQACLTARNNTHAPEGTTRHSPGSTLGARPTTAAKPACLPARRSINLDRQSPEGLPPLLVLLSQHLAPRRLLLSTPFCPTPHRQACQLCSFTSLHSVQSQN
jgi:hypothetical protein